MNVPRSGQRKTKSSKKKNGSAQKTDWKATALMHEETIKGLKVLEEDKEQLEDSLEDLEAILASQRTELKKLRRTAFGEREKIQLQMLSHFYRQMVNASICKDDRKKVDSYISTVQHALKEASK